VIFFFGQWMHQFRGTRSRKTFPLFKESQPYLWILILMRGCIRQTNFTTIISYLTDLSPNFMKLSFPLSFTYQRSFVKMSFCQEIFIFILKLYHFIILGSYNITWKNNAWALKLPSIRQNKISVAIVGNLAKASKILQNF